MDAVGVAVLGAVAALLGAGIGAGGAIAAAAVTGRAQAKSDYARWQREKRAATSTAFLRSAFALQDAICLYASTKEVAHRRGDDVAAAGEPELHIMLQARSSCADQLTLLTLEVPGGLSGKPHEVYNVLAYWARAQLAHWEPNTRRVAGFILASERGNTKPECFPEQGLEAQEIFAVGVISEYLRAAQGDLSAFGFTS
ncbi:hypothetical protein [Streptomyces pseudovenezuelae]|uniref:hypothetical protein n=1 Tax=Streptomyces pseudovenezuelae TaxID=67350 RepID=UPI00371A0EC7